LFPDSTTALPSPHRKPTPKALDWMAGSAQASHWTESARSACHSQSAATAGKISTAPTITKTARTADVAGPKGFQVF
jgi:hypothetical protein